MRNHKKVLDISQETEEHFRFFANMIPDIVWTALPDGYEDFHNEKFTRYSGLSVEEAEGFGWRKIVHPDDLVNLHKTWEQSLINGEPYELEYRLKNQKGEYKWFLVRAIPWKNEEGHIIKWFGTSTDIHYGKTMRENLQKVTGELTRSNDELSRINDILNNFIYIAAHDLRSPVNNMNMLFGLVREEKDAAKKEELMTFIESSIQRLDRTVNGLIEVIRTASEGSGSETLLFEDILQIVLTDLTLNYPGLTPHVRHDFEKCPSVEYVKPYLISILKNLVSNAYKYRSKKRDLEVNIITERDNGWVKLTISDNGKGFKMDISQDIFRPFKRLSDEGEGTGVGLYVIKNIIEKNGGKIEVSSKEDHGTEFKIYLKEYEPASV